MELAILKVFFHLFCLCPTTTRLLKITNFLFSSGFFTREQFFKKFRFIAMLQHGPEEPVQILGVLFLQTRFYFDLVFETLTLLTAAGKS